MSDTGGKKAGKTEGAENLRQQKASPAVRGFSLFEKGRRADFHQLGIMKKIL